MIKNAIYLFSLNALVFSILSCSVNRGPAGAGVAAITNSQGNPADSLAEDTRVSGSGIVGGSNTPGTQRLGAFVPQPVKMDSSPNTTGPTPDPAGMADYMKPGQFVADAQTSIYTGLEISRLTVAKTRNRELRTAAQQLIDAQELMNRELIALAPKLHLRQGETGTLKEDGTLHNKIERLTVLGPDQLDKQYLKYMLKNQRQTVRLYQKALRSAGGPLQSYAGKYLQPLKSQLSSLEALASR